MKAAIVLPKHLVNLFIDLTNGYGNVVMTQCRRIDCEQLRSSINQQLIAGCFGLEALHQLRKKL